MSKSFWNKKTCKQAIEILGQYESYADACPAISKSLGRNVTKDALVYALKQNGFEPPTAYMVKAEKREYDMTAAAARKDPDFFLPKEKKLPKAVADTELDQDVDLLMKTLKSKNCTLRQLCDDVFHAAPKYVEKVVAHAKKKGFNIDLHGDELGFRLPEADFRPQKVKLAPRTEKSYAIGVISDVHFGSLYCLPDAVIEHVEYCYNLGIRDIFCPGDLLEGCYRHARYELSHVRWQDQARQALESLPQKPGLRYHFIDGNHDFTWTEQTGLESGLSLVRLAREMGRDDLFFYGSRGARIDYDGTIIELWHPKKGMGYSKSYGLQNHIRDTNPRYLPHMVFAGHWHQFVQFEQAGVFAVACGTFQHGLGPYGKSLGGDTAVGGLVIRWKLGSDGRISAFSAQHRPVNVADPAFDVPREPPADDGIDYDDVSI